MSQKTDYKNTLNLPQTEFSMRANLAQREPKILKQWQNDNLYQQILEKNKKKKKFIFHDGPPYANGHLHPGTMLNKILKDIVVKYRNMDNYLCDYIPGWDCHGLPIEIQVVKNLGSKKKDLDTVSFRRKCREYAQKFVNIHIEEFSRLGVLGRFSKPYLTMNYDYQATILTEFKKVWKEGGVYREKKPVYWCSSCVTALAEAEVEYADDPSPSIVVKFKLKKGAAALSAEEKETSFLIWTTTPWTLPANLAIAINPNFEYALVETAKERFVLANERVDQVLAKAAIKDYKIIQRFKGKEINGSLCQHPFVDREVKVLTADFVSLETGTGCVHCAPGHGLDDYLFGLKNNLEVYCPVDRYGKFTQDVPQFAGQQVFKANAGVMELLKDKGSLLWQEEIEHSYPHCWRCRKPIIFRATSQWFLSMQDNQLRKKALATIAKVNWIPDCGKERIKGMVEVRPDWCLSRQRSWGIPIVAVVCKKCDQAVIEEKLLDKVIAETAKEGADVWFGKSLEELSFKGIKCPRCQANDWQKGGDILDVWFDSAVSYAAVAEKEKNLGFPVDLYLEGSDQHRGWFQSSLLQAVASRSKAPYKSVLTHGFVVDGQGKKMSKSLGNFIPPAELIDKYGVDVLRLWASAEDYREDIRLSQEILQRQVDTYRRLRNTARFLLGNLSDFDPKKNNVEFAKRDELDRFIGGRLEKLIERVKKYYENYEFYKVVRELHNFCTIELSSFYLDVLKDRLYTSGKDSQIRRGSQSTLAEILIALVKMLAPILCFTVEDIWRHLPWEKDISSAHLLDFVQPNKQRFEQKLDDKWSRLLETRKLIEKELEESRNAKLIGHSLEAAIELTVAEAEKDFYQQFEQRLATICIVSQAKINYQGQETKVAVSKAEGEKCPRCWNIYQELTKDGICHRCAEVLAEV